MSEHLASLQTALSDRYAIERELGRGGMATVYLAQDLKHHRKVALKVLRPELASSIGADRFLREIEIAASLNHPHILALLDSGAAGQRGSGEVLLWYAMPLVEGESLRDRITRETQLPVDEALQITREVADALSHAHSRGVIHRDIKPENILLQDGHAVVADFGIARAIDVAGGSKLTETGLAIGTPAYMSPQQAAGEALDGRADVYGLGCVLYEMLAGTPPFTGATAQAIMARHSVDQVPPIRTLRPGIPEGMEDAIARALAKVPADRFATAAQFGEALRTDGRVSSRAVKAVATGRRWIALAATGIAGALVLGAVILRGAGNTKVNADMVAVAPFRVSTIEPALGYLRDGMIDLLAAKLNDEAGRRVVEQRSILRAWSNATRGGTDADPDEQESLGLAQGLGAGVLVLGSVAGNATQVSLQARLLEVPSGRVRGQAVAEGAKDSLFQLIDRLAEQLLGLQAGVEHRRLTSLTSTSMPAVRLYLQGQSEFRKGRWDEAQRIFRQALDLDTTFALAALALSNSVGTDGDERGARLAYAYRERLSAADRALAEAHMSPPGSPSIDMVARWEAAAAANPDRAQVWYHLGDVYFHWGAGFGLPDALERADSAFRRGAVLDSIAENTDSPVTPEALEHMLWLAVMDRDSARARSLMTTARAADSTNDSYYKRWLLAQATGDGPMLDSLRRHPELAKERDVVSLFTFSQWNGIGVVDVEQVVRSAVQRRVQSPGLWEAMMFNAGRPEAAVAAGAKPSNDYPRALQRDRIRQSIFWDGDSAAATQAAKALAPHADGPREAESERSEYAQYADMCVLEQWRLYHGQTGTAAGAIAKLRAVPYERCASLLDAWLAAETGRPDAGRKVEHLDSLVRSGGADGLNLVIARLYERNGDLASALRAVRRRGGLFGLEPLYQSTFLREEGRLAALAGDAAGAIQAYQHYLALRWNPEPVLKPEVDRVKAELARLVGEPQR